MKTLSEKDYKSQEFWKDYNYGNIQNVRWKNWHRISDVRELSYFLSGHGVLYLQAFLEVG